MTAGAVRCMVRGVVTTMRKGSMTRDEARARVRFLPSVAGVLALGLAACAGTSAPPPGADDRCAGLATRELIDFDIQRSRSSCCCRTVGTVGS